MGAVDEVGEVADEAAVVEVAEEERTLGGYRVADEGVGEGDRLRGGVSAVALGEESRSFDAFSVEF